MHYMRHCLLIGNSRWHWAEQRADTWSFSHTSPDPQKLQSLEISRLTWAAVGPIPKALVLNVANQLVLKNVPLLELPSWLGIDRALAAWGAFKKIKSTGMQSSGLLVADAGTVLSMTLITAGGEFAGGQLIAGRRLQLSAMANGTEHLTDPGTESSILKQFPIETSEAMQRGSLQALVGALVDAHKATNIPLWLCGGDAPVLVDELRKRKLDVVHHPNLALEGMVDLQRHINQNQDL